MDTEYYKNVELSRLEIITPHHIPKHYCTKISTQNLRNYEAFNTIVQSLPLLTRDTQMNILKSHKLIKCKKTL